MLILALLLLLLLGVSLAAVAAAKRGAGPAHGKALASIDCPRSPAYPIDRRETSDRLRVVTFNAEWLFLSDAVGSGGRKPATTAANCPGSGCTWETDEEARNHLLHVAQVLDRLNADVVVLQEVQSCGVMETLRAALPRQAQYRSFMVRGTDTATGQNVGLLTKVDPYNPLTRVSSRVDWPVPGSQCGYTSNTTLSSGVSKHFFTTIQVKQRRIGLVGLHLLAMPVMPSRCAQREAQAAVIRDAIFNGGFASEIEDLIVFGDINDYDGDVLDVSDNTPTSRVIHFLGGQEVPPAAAETQVQTQQSAAPFLLHNIASFVSKAQRYTAWYDRNGNCIDDGGPEHTSIDHTFVSSSLFQRVQNAFIDHSYEACCKCPYSDHWPVVVDISV